MMEREEFCVNCEHKDYEVLEIKERCEEYEEAIKAMKKHWEKSEQEKRNVKREFRKVNDKLTDSKNAYKHLHDIYEKKNTSQNLTELELKHSKKQLQFMLHIVQTFVNPNDKKNFVSEPFETLQQQYKTAKEQLTQILKRDSKCGKYPAWIDN